MGGILQVDSIKNNNTSNLITQTNSTTITIGASGQTISLASGASSSGFGLTWNQTVQTTNFTASVGVGYMVNTSTAAVTVTLPASPSIGDQVQLVDYNETTSINNIILNGNGLKIDGTTDTSNISNSSEGVTLMYSGTTRGWIPVSSANQGTNALTSFYALDFLVVAGGGGGGSYYNGGGGGAGGFRTSTQNIVPGTVITVTVGDGGAGGAGINTGSIGSNSSISGSGITTITSNGGGGGGTSATNATNGGSGGGGGGSGYGLGNTPSTSPSQGNDGGVAPEGGGGGAGGAGTTIISSPRAGGSGGIGSQSSITGTATYYAGGGGGGDAVQGGTGGAGGGGNGSPGQGSAGTANTGGGGGGSERSPSSPGGAGGKGVVIISVATVHYSSTSSGSPTVTTNGSNTILKFTGSGTYTV
jgi:hypothetical protein